MLTRQGPAAPTTSGQVEAAEVRKELKVIEGQMSELNKRLSEARKHEAQLRFVSRVSNFPSSRSFPCRGRSRSEEAAGCPSAPVLYLSRARSISSLSLSFALSLASLLLTTITLFSMLRMDNLSMEADKVKESSEYKHLYQVLQTERKQHSEERASMRVSWSVHRKGSREATA